MHSGAPTDPAELFDRVPEVDDVPVALRRIEILAGYPEGLQRLLRIPCRSMGPANDIDNGRAATASDLASISQIDSKGDRDVGAFGHREQLGEALALPERLGLLVVEREFFTRVPKRIAAVDPGCSREDQAIPSGLPGHP